MSSFSCIPKSLVRPSPAVSQNAVLPAHTHATLPPRGDQVSNIGMLRDYRAQLREIKVEANEERRGDAGAENIDPIAGGSRPGHSCG